MEVKLICMGHMTPLLVTWPRECLGLRQCLVNKYIYSLNYFVRKSILYMYLMMIKSHNLFSVLSCVFWTYDDSVDSTSSWRNKWMKINVNSLVFVSKCLFLKNCQMWCLIKYVLDNWGLAEVDFISVHDIKLIHVLST